MLRCLEARAAYSIKSYKLRMESAFSAASDSCFADKTHLHPLLLRVKELDLWASAIDAEVKKWEDEDTDSEETAVMTIDHKRSQLTLISFNLLLLLSSCLPLPCRR